MMQRPPLEAVFLYVFNLNKYNYFGREDPMNIIKTFGTTVSSLSEKHPVAARNVLKAGWMLQDARFRFFPDRRLNTSDAYLSTLTMDTMRAPLRHPEETAMVSIFTPCEIMQEAGLIPYSVEGMSCYISASEAEAPMIEKTSEYGLPETLCSYHRVFAGTALKGILPAPKLIAYTNVACDANMLTFKALAEYYDVPSFFIEVPAYYSKAAVSMVADELRELADFICRATGKKTDEEALKKRVARSKRTLELFARSRRMRADKFISTDIVSPLYLGLTNNLLLGTKEGEKYVNMLLADIRKAPEKKGKHIYWMHTLPFWSDSLKKSLLFSERAQIVGDELADVADADFDSDHPFEAMAQRLINNATNGNITRRIELGIKHAKETGADGVVWFNHWGCKHTIGGSNLAKKMFEEAGIPLLVLDGDGCDHSHGGEGQTATRLEAFLELLEQEG